jgi:hypothetical protein
VLVLLWIEWKCFLLSATHIITWRNFCISTGTAPIFWHKETAYLVSNKELHYFVETVVGTELELAANLSWVIHYEGAFPWSLRD